jgi:hypothetical protein
MPRGPLSPAARARISARMKAHWQNVKTPTPAPTPNGLHLEQRLILHVHGQELTLTPPEAERLKQALDHVLPAIPPAPPEEPR